MKTALDNFKTLIEQCSTSEGLYQYLDSQKIPLDFSNLLRWQWTLSVSALDRYIHDIVRIGMVQSFDGKRPQTAKFRTFHIDMNKFTIITNSPIPTNEFEQEIARQHSFLAFQLPDKIADALSYIWDENDKWNIISRNMKTPITSRDLRTKLTNIVIRRNQIVHEGDCFTAGSLFQQQPISLVDTKNVTGFISELAESIHTSVT